MKNQRKIGTTRAPEWILACSLGGILLFGTHPARAQQDQSAQVQPPAGVFDQRETPPPQGATPSEKLHLLVGRSLIISSPTRIRRVSIADPSIADAVIITPNQILLNGKAPGGVSLVLWDESDQSQTFEVFVDMDILGLSQKIRDVFPDEPVRVEASKDVVLLSGRASSKAVADRIFQIVSAATPKVISLMEAPSRPTTGEVLLEVKFAEVDRTALSQIGINVLSLGGGKGAGNTIASGATQQFGPPQLPAGLFPPGAPTPGGTTSAGTVAPGTGQFTLSDLLNVFVFRPDINLAVTIRALEQRSLLQILAEPNLLTQTGKEASFLAGGEFPYPVVQGGAAGTVPTVTIQFKEFGVRLNFMPELTEDNRIHIKVRPEVSSLDFTNALTISGFFIPALSTRRVQAEMDLQDGQSFAIAGLVDNRLTEIANKVPGLGDLPILGHFFRSRSLNKSKTELLVMVTPHIVKQYGPGQGPTGPQFPKPFLGPAISGAAKQAAPK